MVVTLARIGLEKDLIVMAQIYLNSLNFKSDVMARTGYRDATILPHEILRFFEEYGKEIICVEAFDFGWRGRNVYGRVINKRGVAEINSRRFNRKSDFAENFASIVGTIVHEIGHVIDVRACKALGISGAMFGHGKNRRDGNEMATFPYYIGACAEEFVLDQLRRKNA